MTEQFWMRSVVAACMALTPIGASADITIPSMTYRTGPYAAGGIPFSDGYADYITLLNERDGGIEGERINLIECDFGYATDRGVECFDQLVEQGGLVFSPLSTGVTISIMERAHKEGIPILASGYGLTAVADGDTFNYAFNFPAHYWHAATTQINHIKEIEGGALAGKKIMHMHHNSGYGREPIPTLEAMAARDGFELVLNPVDHPGEDQTAAWEIVQAEQPDYILFWGWGIMNTVGLEQAIANNFPRDRFFGTWWSTSESDIKPFKMEADGYKAVTFHAVGTGFKIFNDMNLLVYQTDKARGDLNNIGDVLYNRGIMNAIFVTEAIRSAMIQNNTKDPTRDMVRDALETMQITDANLDALGMSGFVPPFQISCADHSGEGMVAVKQWDARIRKWKIVTPYYEPDQDLITPQVTAAAEAFRDGADISDGHCASN
jgi:branched-chain amino acid transport system substrate-binding protein